MKLNLGTDVSKNRDRLYFFGIICIIGYAKSLFSPERDPVYVHYGMTRDDSEKRYRR